MNPQFSDSESCLITPPIYRIICYLSSSKRSQGPLNLFSDIVYAVNLIPWLSRSFVKLYTNPLGSRGFHSLAGKRLPTYIQHVRSHSHFSGPISERNTLADQTTYGTSITSTEQADQFHSCTHTNKKGFHAHFPHISLAQL